MLVSVGDAARNDLNGVLVLVSLLTATPAVMSLGSGVVNASIGPAAGGVSRGFYIQYL